MPKRGGILVTVILLVVGVGFGLVVGYGVSEMSRGKSLTQIVVDATRPGSPAPRGEAGLVATPTKPVPPPDGTPVNFDSEDKAPVSEGASVTDEDGFPSLAPLVERCRPAVVSVGLYFSEEDIPEMRRRLREQAPERQSEEEVPMLSGSFMPLGSGFVVSPEGLVVTNKHVVDVTQEVGSTPTIRLVNGDTFEAEIAGADAETDVALLRVSPSEPMDYMMWADSDEARIGDWVIAIGNPFGLESSVSLGILSARGRQLATPRGSGGHTYDDYLQTDAAINPGNSGGPLINVRGEVVGINTAIQTAGPQSPWGTPGNIGIGFAIPSNLASWVVSRLNTYGEVERGYIGVEVPNAMAEKEMSQPVDGALLTGITEDGPAEDAGLRSGDVVVRLDGQPVNSAKDLIDIIAETDVGVQISVGFVRDGEEMDTALRVAKRPTVEELERSMFERSPRRPDPGDPLGDILE
ncbi:MAG: trypsin-like serine protease [Armatimonadia bacterium]|nr:trypsin-like serine protease [Armatimonadia bacterium]